jgi:hypothetical protein
MDKVQALIDAHLKNNPEKGSRPCIKAEGYQAFLYHFVKDGVSKAAKTAAFQVAYDFGKYKHMDAEVSGFLSLVSGMQVNDVDSMIHFIEGFN